MTEPYELANESVHRGSLRRMGVPDDVGKVAVLAGSLTGVPSPSVSQNGSE